jgi:hypothetical protein
MFIAVSTSSGTLGYGTSMLPGIVMTLLLKSTEFGARNARD